MDADDFRPMFLGMGVLGIGIFLAGLIGPLGGIASLLITIAFLWMLHETKWLTIHLERYVSPVSSVLNATIEIIPLLIRISFIAGAVTSGFFGIKPTKKKRQVRKTDKIKGKCSRFLAGFFFMICGCLIYREVTRSIESVLKTK